MIRSEASVAGVYPTQPLHLRAASAGRAIAFAALHRQAFDRAWTADEFRHLIEGPCTFALEAAPQANKTEGEALADPLGFIVARAVAGEAEILTLAVHPDARRRGLGRALVEGAASSSCGLGADALWLEVAVDNAAAIGLYEVMHFQIAGRRPHYYARAGGARVDALVMRRRLNSGAG
jgi:ribosomal-protein-alanine N-acetyltransferase